MNNTPVVNFHFSVEWGGSSINFSEVSGLKVQHEVIEYRSGASPDYSTIKIPGLKKYSNIVLKRGVVSNDNEFYNWLKTVGITAERRDLTISVLNHEHEPIVVWRIRNAWPIRLEFGELNAIKSEILIESLELAHDGLSILD